MKAKSGHFLYFAYGSNLSTKRIHIENPSAVAVSNALLNDYELQFRFPSKRWHGCSATIMAKKGAQTWGVLWDLENKHLSTLDNQEGVHDKIYERIDVELNVEVEGRKEIVKAYSYQIMQKNLRPLHLDCRPSKVYKDVILAGAKENKLPLSYQEKLRQIEDNGYDGKVEITIDLSVQDE